MERPDNAKTVHELVKRSLCVLVHQVTAQVSSFLWPVRRLFMEDNRRLLLPERIKNGQGQGAKRINEPRDQNMDLSLVPCHGCASGALVTFLDHEVRLRTM